MESQKAEEKLIREDIEEEETDVIINSLSCLPNDIYNITHCLRVNCSND